jgi:hypothetical protein
MRKNIGLRVEKNEPFLDINQFVHAWALACLQMVWRGMSLSGESKII